MQKVYVLQAQGFGDREKEFYNIGVYSSKDKLEAALVSMQEEWLIDDFDVVTKVEEYTLDA